MSRIEPTVPGALVISLDFELFWGMRDVMESQAFLPFAEGVRKVIPALLERFSAQGIHATWAAVGMLLFDDKQDLLRNLPAKRPGYDRPELSPYANLEEVGTDEAVDPLHFGIKLARKILATPYQELGTHTFSHYYVLEPSQTAEEFAADLDSAIRAVARLGRCTESLVFPRNHVNENYLGICAQKGIRAYRGNPDCRYYDPARKGFKAPWARLVRLADSVINLTGHHAALPTRDGPDRPWNIPASRFLRPSRGRCGMMEHAKASRIKKGMTHAAKQGRIFHLWWHPHNFGLHLDSNMALLDTVLDHADRLAREYAFRSLTMSEAAEAYGEIGSGSVATS